MLPRRRRLPIDADERPVTELAANVLDRQFNVSAPNRSWAADFTYIWTAEGWPDRLRGEDAISLSYCQRNRGQLTYSGSQFCLAI